MLGVLDWARRDLLVPTRRSKRSADFIALLAEIDRRWAPTPGGVARPVVLVLDNGPIHTGRATRAALAARAHWLAVEWLPRYAPELNDIEALWRELLRGAAGRGEPGCRPHDAAQPAPAGLCRGARREPPSFLGRASRGGARPHQNPSCRP